MAERSSGRPGGRCSAPSEPVRPRVPLPPPPPPPPPRFPAPPRFPVPDRARAVRRDGRRHALADRAAAAQAVAAPPRPNPSARACCCRRRRRSTRCPCVVRVALCMCMYVVCVWTYVTLEPLSMIVDRYSGWMVAGGPAGGWLLILYSRAVFICTKGGLLMPCVT